MSKRLRSLQLLAAVAIGSASAPSLASVCSGYAAPGEMYGEGSTVCFVWDSADVDPLYGSLMVSGDNIFVLPNDFRAEATGSGDSDIVSAFGFIQVIAKTGFVLDGITVGEIGDYELSGASSSVSVSAEMEVYDWLDGSGPTESKFLNVTGPLSIADGNPHNWSATESIDLTTAIWDDVDHVGLSLENILTAESDGATDYAWIQKKAIGSEITVSVDTSPIPVPAAVWLFMSGLLSLIGISRRKC